jgi:hypothetical protein
MCTENVESIASAIRQHLEANPRAADSVAGIMRWWWQRNRYEHERNRVIAALERLVSEGIVGVRHASDGEALYFLSVSRGGQ